MRRERSTAMRRKRTKSPLESPWFNHAVVIIGSLGVGLPVTILLLLDIIKDPAPLAPGKIAIAVSPFLTCIATGYLILLLSYWLRSGDG